MGAASDQGSEGQNAEGVMWRGWEGSSKERVCAPRPKNRGTWGCQGMGALWFRLREPRVQRPGDGNLDVFEDLLVSVAGAEEVRGEEDTR